jgi:hypothetical protein
MAIKVAAMPAIPTAQGASDKKRNRGDAAMNPSRQEDRLLEWA